MTTTIRLTTAAELVAAVPALLGFHPENSLVLIFTRNSRQVLTARADLPEQGQAEQYAQDAAESIRRTQIPADRVAMVVVGPEARPDVVDAVSQRLAELGFKTDTRLWALGTDAGQAYMCVDGCCGGVIPDPLTTDIGIATAVAGRVVMRSRDALARMMAPTVDEATLERRRDMIVAELEATPDPRQVSALPLRDALHDVEHGGLKLDDRRVAAIARALMSSRTQAAVIRWALKPCLQHVHELFLVLTREIPAPCRADAAAMLALTSLLKGEGALANEALIVAESSASGHKLAELVLDVADMSPRQLRQVLANALAMQA